MLLRGGVSREVGAGGDGTTELEATDDRAEQREQQCAARGHEVRIVLMIQREIAAREIAMNSRTWRI